MGHGPFGIMFQLSSILSCLLLAGWITSTIAESEKKPVCASDSSNVSRCPPGKIVTDEIAQDELFPIDYTAQEMCDCLDVTILEKYLEIMSSYAFADEQVDVVKEKLNETGYPDSVLRQLGGLMVSMGPEDIKNWRFNLSETLASLLAQDPSPEQAAAIIRQYTDSGGPMNAEALNATGTKYICLLDPDQLKKIDENAIRGADPLNISNCNQTTKDILYPQAKRAFSHRHNSSEYYKRIKPYLEGAPGQDLKALSKDNVNMDIETFMKLRKDAILKLRPSEVKGLMGENLKDLKKEENNSPVKDWIDKQQHSELDKLKIGLKVGRPEGYMNITPSWVPSTIAESEETFECTGGYGNVSRCPSGKIVTDKIAQNKTSMIDYTAQDMCDCLNVTILEKYLEIMSYYSFNNSQRDVVKEKLNETGYPDSVLRQLGGLMVSMSPEDIKNWRFNSSETLASLLAQDPSPEQAAAIIRQYTDSGGPMNAEALNATGTKYICLLDPDQLKKIDENAIRGADPLNISNCNQTTKDILYPQAKRAFSHRHNSSEYYKRIKPYLEGAPGQDLKALSKDNVNMDIETFMKLRKDAILKLRPSEVKGLMGENLKELKEQENNSPVKDWIDKQQHSELDKLKIGLKVGRPEGYMNITPRPPVTSGGPRGLARHLFPSLLLTLLLTSFVS